MVSKSDKQKQKTKTKKKKKKKKKKERKKKGPLFILYHSPFNFKFRPQFSLLFPLHFPFSLASLFPLLLFSPVPSLFPLPSFPPSFQNYPQTFQGWATRPPLVTSLDGSVLWLMPYDFSKKSQGVRITSRVSVMFCSFLIWSSYMGAISFLEFFDLPIGGHKNIAEVLSDDSRPPFWMIRNCITQLPTRVARKFIFLLFQ